MGSDHNRTRGKWQDYSGANASVSEKALLTAFKNYFLNSYYQIREKPNEFNRIYVDVPLSQDVLDAIYNPKIEINKHGLSPDYVIDNLNTGKSIYIEVKRQDGWVEGKPRSAGRGNAHERSCKYFTPGLLNILRNKGGIVEPHLPFWTIFQGDITRDPCRVREITCWYGEYINHVFFWRNTLCTERLFLHFETFIAPLLD